MIQIYEKQLWKSGVIIKYLKAKKIEAHLAIAKGPQGLSETATPSLFWPSVSKFPFQEGLGVPAQLSVRASITQLPFRLSDR